MKRCAQCEFIYEDDQAVCDMDGQSLVQYNEFSPLPSQNLAVIGIAKPDKTSTLRGIALPASAGVLLAALFSLGFYVSSSGGLDTVSAEIEMAEASEAKLQDSSGLDLKLSSVQIAVSGVETEQEALPSSDLLQASSVQSRSDFLPETPKQAHPKGDDPRFSIPRSLPPLPRVRPLPRLPNARPVETKAGSLSVIKTPARMRSQYPAPPHPVAKKDSRVSSFLKKTGRVLSKPFKL